MDTENTPTTEELSGSDLRSLKRAFATMTTDDKVTFLAEVVFKTLTKAQLATVVDDLMAANPPPNAPSEG